MSARVTLTPLLVEQALRLLPDVDALMPLRALLVSASRTPGSGEPYQTVGKRQVQPPDLRTLGPQAVARVTAHLEALYGAAVEALEADRRGDLPAAVAALIRAGRREEEVGRLSQARTWYDHALRTAEPLRERPPEIDALRRLGRLEARRGHLDEGARFLQRSLALAEAEFDDQRAARACLALGDVHRLELKWPGADSWYARGLRHAGDDHVLLGRLRLGSAEVARARGHLEAAGDLLDRARETFEKAGDAEGQVRTLNTRGRLETELERYPAALACFREALARVKTAQEGGPRLEVAIRLNLCRLYLAWDRLPDVEDEVRRAEEIAIVHNLTRSLAQLYVIMGWARAAQEDERGFIFFEKAVELCRGSEPSPRLEAEVYLEYGRFRKALGDRDEARGYVERAREILETLGNGPMLAAVDVELAALDAS